MSDHMPFVYDDGGRGRAGYKGHASDCVARAVAVASQKPYKEVYAALALGAGQERKSKGRSARNGIYTRRAWFKRYMTALGFVWTPTMRIGSGCTVHLVEGELPYGRLVVSVSGHYTAVINRTIHDTHDPQRTTFWYGDQPAPVRVSERCVYGYWTWVGQESS